MSTLIIRYLLSYVILASIISLTLESPTNLSGKRKNDIKEKRRNIKKQTEPQLEPWQLNEGICPPSLCAPVASALTENEDIQLEGSVQRSFPFFEGDIVLDDDLAKIVDHKKRSKRAIVKPSERLWKYGVVPLMIDDSIVGKARSAVQKAIDYIEKKSCIRFLPRKKKDKNYLLVTSEIGCWSFVGQKTGQQTLSIGKGCEQFGTVLHELGHALGFWHEQSRPDRDKYVEIVMKNISPRYYSQFGKRNSKETTSRSFPYDYLSIMHYKDKDFSKNTRRTIKVIGTGEKNKFKIGQRKGLSEIDIAQINDMYYCNHKDSVRKACNKGWVNNKGSCYSFYPDKKLNFGDATKFCVKQKGYLVHINNAAEDTFLKDYLIKHYKSTNIWRVGGKKYQSGFKWYDSSKKKNHLPMKYKAFSKGYPKSYNTVTLIKKSKKFVWGATWAGSDEKPSSNVHAVICEAKRKGKCFKTKTKDGRDYRGSINYTKSLTTCQYWTSQYPHPHKYITGVKFFDDSIGLGNHNYCRNPSGRRTRPWCFTSKSKPTWEYCDVNMC